MKFWMAALLILLAGPGVAQQHQHGHSPYAGLQQRGVKALSDQQLGDLRAGRGMGLALAAELNGYPGPAARPGACRPACSYPPTRRSVSTGSMTR